jgi:hypothetical protein
MPQGEKLSRNQEKAIAALLTKPTVEEAATEAGVTSRTLRNWFHDSGFAAAYRAERRRAVDHGVAKLQAGMVAAVNTLMDAMSDSELDASDRIRAADAFLKHVMKGVEQLDLAEQLRQIQEELDAYKTPEGIRPYRGAGVE